MLSWLLLPLLPAVASTAPEGRTISLPITRRLVAVPHRWGTARWHHDSSNPILQDTHLGRIPSMPFLTVYIGIPQQPLYVQVDTGSSDFVLPSVRCKACGVERAFQCNASVTCHPGLCGAKRPNQRCPFQITYGDGGTVRGVVVEDNMNLAVEGLPPMSSAIYIDLIQHCHPKGLFSSRFYNGIFGLGPTHDTGNRFPAPLTMVLKEHHLADIFAMYTGSDIGGAGGMLTIGGIDKRMFHGPVQYTPMVRQGCVDWDYCARATALEVGRERILHRPQDFGVVLIDSGTTLSLVPKRVFRALRDHFQANYCHLPLVCRPHRATLFDGECIISDTVPEGFPVIRWHFDEGVVVNVPPEAYFLRSHHNRTGTKFCFGIEAVPHVSGNPDTTLGDTFMAAAYVIFDRQERRIGFATPITLPGSAPHVSRPETGAHLVIAFGFNAAVFLAAALMMWRSLASNANSGSGSSSEGSTQRYGAL